MSPINSRHQIEKFINETNDEILIYVQTVTDPNIINLLQKLDNNGKKVIVCTADNEGNRAVFETSGLDCCVMMGTCFCEVKILQPIHLIIIVKWGFCLKIVLTFSKKYVKISENIVVHRFAFSKKL